MSNEFKEAIEMNEDGAIFVSKQPWTPPSPCTTRSRRNVPAPINNQSLACCDSLALAATTSEDDVDDDDGNHTTSQISGDSYDDTSVVSLELLTVVDDDGTDKTRLQRWCGKRLLGCWCLGLVLLILAIVLPLTLRKDDTNRDGIDVSDGTENSGIDFVSDGDSSNVDAYEVLKPLVSNPDALLDPSTPEGQAFLDVENSNEQTSFDIQQQYALQMLYHSTEGEAWVFNHGWESYGQRRQRQLQTTTMRKRTLTETSLCGWAGISICRNLGNGRYAVAGLDLDSNNLRGSIPEDLCLLNSLESLRVANNQLEGTVPSCLASKKTLLVLEVEGNELLLESAVSDPSFCEENRSWSEFVTDCSVDCSCCTKCVE